MGCDFADGVVGGFTSCDSTGPLSDVVVGDVDEVVAKATMSTTHPKAISTKSSSMFEEQSELQGVAKNNIDKNKSL